MSGAATRLRLAVLLAAVTALLPAGAPVQKPHCDTQLVVAVHRLIEPVAAQLAEVHFNYTSGRHYEVVEIISVFHVDRLCRSAMRYVEAMRVALVVLVCPSRHVPPEDYGEVAQGPDAGELLRALGLLGHLEKFFADVRHVAKVGSTPAPEVSDVWNMAEQELREVSVRMQTWIGQMFENQQGARMLPQTYENVDPLLRRVLRMVVDFVSSLAEDLAALFNAPNYVALEMFPDAVQPSLGKAELRANIFTNSAGGLAFNPDFMGALQRAPVPLAQPPSFEAFRMCDAAPAADSIAPADFVDMPREWAHRDVTGVPRRQPSPLQVLLAIGRHMRLSNLFISVQISPYLLAPPPKCGSRFVLYDPSHCLLEQGWGGYFFHLNPLPPYNFTVVYSGKPLGPGPRLTPTDVHSIEVPTMDMQWSSLVSTFKSMNHHSPDMLFMSPLVGNCLIIDRLLKTGSVKPKLVVAPINPVEPPPREVAPNYVEWWAEHAQNLMRQLLGLDLTSDGDVELPITTSMWLAQCSLTATVNVLRQQGYMLLHVEHTFAVFLWRRLWRTLHKQVEGGSQDEAAAGGDEEEAVGDAWVTGWRCSPHARYLFDLEVFATDGEALVPAPTRAAPSSSALQTEATSGGADRTRQEAPHRHAAAAMREAPVLRYFLERSPARGQCVDGICECFPPHRGPLCQEEDPPLRPQALRAAIHYITADTEGDVRDLQRSLSTLWVRFNQQHDYPVLIFHEGLRLASRQALVDASGNRVWFVKLQDFGKIPPEWSSRARESAEDFSVGYRAMIRWRSGPVFLEPALANFDYAMTLDTDSYFPAYFAEDPFQVLHRGGLTAAFPHLGRESASVVVNFMHHFLLYCKLHGLHPRRTRMLASLIEKNFKWYQQCLMLDIEVLRLDWFRGGSYQDMFRYMDATGGFWLHRWGNNPFRTFAVGLLLDDGDVRSMNLPYAHQDFCSCGAGAPPCDWNVTAEAFECSSSPPSSPAQPALGDLDEGLLDLQPWRGTERQRSRFKNDDFYKFVQEQLPSLS